MASEASAMIVAAQPEAAEAGARVLMKGGNAVDAALAAALVQGVVDPQMCGVAGFGAAQILDPVRGVHRCVDFHARTPLAARPDMWLDRLEGETRDGFGFLLRDAVNDLGHQAVATPSALRAFAAMASEFGSWDWADVVAPAVAQAEKGFFVRPHVFHWWTHGAEFGRVPVERRLAHSATGRAAYFRTDGSPKRIGEHVANPDLAATLRRIARHGAEDFHTGEIAERLADDMAAHGGLITTEDLAAARPVWREPLRGSYRGLDVATNHPPGGGIMLIEMLNILEAFDLASVGHNTTEYLRIVCEAMKAATADKDAHVGDPDFVTIPAWLTEKAHAERVAGRIRAGERLSVPRLGQPETPHTTHVVVADREGRVVTMTHSLGMPSGVIPDGLGFMLNGCMGVFDPRPGRAGSIAPGKARFSSICPTIVLEDGAPRVALGAPGGTQIAMGVLQALLNVIDFGMTMAEAVSQPRFSATSDVIDVTNRIPGYVVEPLEAAGYAVQRSALTFGVAAVHGIRWAGRRLDGGADPGHDGVALAV
jgi:gamma-glutamyltranspeptidase/glutathione hydrolase